MKELRKEDMSHLKENWEKANPGKSWDEWVQSFTSFVNSVDVDNTPNVEKIDGRGWYNAYRLMGDKDSHLVISAVWVDEGMEDPRICVTGEISHAFIDEDDIVGWKYAHIDIRDRLVTLIRLIRTRPSLIIMNPPHQVIKHPHIDFVDMDQFVKVEEGKLFSQELYQQVDKMMKDKWRGQVVDPLNLIEMCYKIRFKTTESMYDVTNMLNCLYDWHPRMVHSSNSEYTMYECQLLMICGIEMRHSTYYTDDQWAKLDPGTNRVINSSGYRMDWDEFWKDKQWDGWVTFKRPPGGMKQVTYFPTDWASMGMVEPFSVKID